MFPGGSLTVFKSHTHFMKSVETLKLENKNMGIFGTSKMS